MKLDVLYFAWIRERIGVAKETLETDAKTVADLVQELHAREERYEFTFQDMSSVRVSVDQELCDFETPLKDGQEIAFFPPMTGG